MAGSRGAHAKTTSRTWRLMVVRATIGPAVDPELENAHGAYHRAEPISNHGQAADDVNTRFGARADMNDGAPHLHGLQSSAAAKTSTSDVRCLPRVSGPISTKITTSTEKIMVLIIMGPA